MPKMPPPCHNVGEAPPRFASAAEIALAEALRRQLEERYLGPAAAQEAFPTHPDPKH